jgi:hypothetical protein
MVNRPLVAVVDDDESVRESLPDLLREFGFAVQAFSSAEEFLASDCVVTVQASGVSSCQGSCPRGYRNGRRSLSRAVAALSSVDDAP